MTSNTVAYSTKHTLRVSTEDTPKVLLQDSSSVFRDDCLPNVSGGYLMRDGYRGGRLAPYCGKGFDIPEKQGNLFSSVYSTTDNPGQ